MLYPTQLSPFGSIELLEVPDSAITASSQWSNDYPATSIRKTSRGWWKPTQGTQGNWLKWDFGDRQLVSSVWTKSFSTDHGVKAYTLSYSDDGNTWLEHPQRFSDLSFGGTTKVVKPGIFARWVRLNIMEQVGEGHVKVELFGSKSWPVRLKLEYCGEFYRLCSTKPEYLTSYDALTAAVASTIGKHTKLKLTYTDEEQDRCVLNGATFPDFLLTISALGNAVIKLNVEACVANSPGNADLQQSQPIMEEEEALLSDQSEFEDLFACPQADDSIDEGFQIVRGSGQCFVKRNLLPTPDGDFKTVSTLQVGDYVLGSKGQHLEITYKKVHPKRLYEFATFRTAAAELTVTVDHRIVVPSSAGGEKLAGCLELGDIVVCGSKRQRITKIMKFEQRAELVEFRFNPDESVATFMTSPCGILTKGGNEPRYATRPLLANETQRRARSCDP